MNKSVKNSVYHLLTIAWNTIWKGGWEPTKKKKKIIIKLL